MQKSKFSGRIRLALLIAALTLSACTTQQVLDVALARRG